MAKVLIIEDELSLAIAYSFLLRHEGHKVVVAHDGEEGLTKAAKAAADLIIVDMMMPRLDGLGFLRQYMPLKKPGVKILILSNMASRTYEKEAIELGANRYEIKAQLSPPQLLKIVNELLNTK